MWITPRYTCGVEFGILNISRVTCIWKCNLRRVVNLLYGAVVFVTAVRIIVTGWSMHPTLASGEYVLFDRLAYVFGGPKRGDIVLAHVKYKDNKKVVKRVVGIPGDTIRLASETIFVNDVPIIPLGHADGMTTYNGHNCIWVLNENEWFLLSDNMIMMDMNIDSRSYGPVSRKAIKARAWMVLWPFNRWRSLDIE